MNDFKYIKSTAIGNIYKDDKGVEWILRDGVMSEYAQNEYLAYKFYKLAGINVPNFKLLKLNNTYSTGFKYTSLLLSPITKNDYDKLWFGFGIDTLLGNVDIFGDINNNILKNNDGIVFRMNLGGSLLFNIHGVKKSIADWDFNKSKSKTKKNINEIFKNMSNFILKESLLNVVSKITYSKIEYLVNKYGPDQEDDKTNLINILKYRLKLLYKKIQILSEKDNNHHPKSAIYTEPHIYNDIFLQQINYVNTLDTETMDAVKYYTGSGYIKLNKFLRHPIQPNIQENINYINLIDCAFKYSPPLEKSIVVYRGITLSNKIDADFTDCGYISTTANKNIALKFNANKTKVCCLFEIYIPKGSHVLPIVDISNYSDEMEILLPRGGTFHITKKDLTPTKNTIITKFIEKLSTKSFETSSLTINTENWKALTYNILLDNKNCEWSITNFNGNINRIKQEYTAYLLYSLVGVFFNERKIINIGNAVYIAQLDIKNTLPVYTDYVSEFWPGYVYDCWLANWSVGKGMQLDGSNDKPIRTNLENIFTFNPTSNDVDELYQYKEPTINGMNADIFEYIDFSTIVESIEKFRQLDGEKFDEQIKNIIMEYGPGDEEQRKTLYTIIIERKSFILNLKMN